ncbi:hypothetical protein ACT17_14605 [Mycolicibacterium conceptionense]|uniref:Uncharacterized protein n=1 Tax=Mycolicibacterium conceptionense TaxID=451644 RepID=A0A0J8U7Y9_9MYCO|nr:hypothetical protein [Mycolicibacterium conceptionense]KMV17526.1 hypothetical protein ACT17_14605 [Mycolicibacterium conceptionense]
MRVPDPLHETDCAEEGTQYWIAFTDTDFDAANSIEDIPERIGTRYSGTGWLVVSPDRTFFQDGFSDDEILILDRVGPNDL